MMIFKSQEVAFLDRITREIPIILENFNVVAHMDPSKRLTWSDQKLNNVFRDGWFVNTPVGTTSSRESVADHKKHLCRLAEIYYPVHMQLTLKAYANIHDNQEVIAHALINGVRRDLNPRFNKNSYSISGEAKDRVEQIAIEMVLEDEPDQLRIWREYKAKESACSKEFGSLDKLCVMWKCVSFVESGQFDYPDFQRYWDYWSLDKVREEISPITARAYEDDLWPRIQRLRNG